MIIIRINGGLGNQMFQYATGRAASLRNQTQLVLDIEFFKAVFTKQKHEQALAIELFSAIKAQRLVKLTGDEVLAIEDKSHGFIRRKNDKVRDYLGLPVSFKQVFETQLLHFQPDFKQHKADTLYMTGDWQNEQYFNDYESTIRQDFIFPAFETNSLNASLLEKITSTNSIAVHVRRGDYVSSTTHQPTSADYYKEAIKLMISKVANPSFFIFSDDIAWCKDNLALPDANYVSHNVNEYSYRDMQLMSNCQHNIIANSSFSWWGAWLNCNPKKLIIVPKIWLAKHQIMSTTITPPDWIKL